MKTAQALGDRRQFRLFRRRRHGIDGDVVQVLTRIVEMERADDHDLDRLRPRRRRRLGEGRGREQQRGSQGEKLQHGLLQWAVQSRELTISRRLLPGAPSNDRRKPSIAQSSLEPDGRLKPDRIVNSRSFEARPQNKIRCP